MTVCQDPESRRQSFEVQVQPRSNRVMHWHDSGPNVTLSACSNQDDSCEISEFVGRQVAGSRCRPPVLFPVAGAVPSSELTEVMGPSLPPSAVPPAAGGKHLQVPPVIHGIVE